MNSITLNFAGAGNRLQETGSIPQHEIILLAQMISGLQPLTPMGQGGDAQKRLLAELNHTAEVSNAAFTQACASLSINPMWVGQKYADQLVCRTLFTGVSVQAVMVVTDETHKSQSNLIKGLFGLALSHRIFGRATLVDLYQMSGERGLADVHEATIRVIQTRDSFTQFLLEEAGKAITSAGDLWNANIRNKLRDIAFEAIDLETAVVSNEEEVARIKKAVDVLLHVVGVTPLHVV